MVSASYEALNSQVAGERAALLAHPVYSAVSSLPRLRFFMETHVFAVWDFMSLLKTLQRRLTSIAIPWTPPRSRVAARLVNSLVLAEESDEVELWHGSSERAPISHFELYVRAMGEVGADTGPIHRHLAALEAGASVNAALEAAAAPVHAAAFVRTTFALLEDPHDEAVAAAFLVGREDLVPEMFRRLLPEVARVRPEPAARSLPLYLARHIDLDEEEHGPLARRLLAELCHDDATAWSRAADAGRRALGARRALWDGVVSSLG